MNTLIHGAAGSGKTTRLFEMVPKFETHWTWKPYQRILAITFMHGSRRRLQKKVNDLGAISGRVTCTTIDSFCFDLVKRYRRILGKDASTASLLGLTEGSALWERPNFSSVRTDAVKILKHSPLKDCLANTFPLVIIDELQDCVDDLFEIVQALAAVTTILAAGDSFQCLSQETPPVMNWAERSFDTIPLSDSYRTSDSALLATAAALREGISTANHIPVFLCPSANQMAAKIAYYLQFKGWKNGGQVAIISPSGPTKAAVAKGAIEKLEAGFKTSKKLKPCKFCWEANQDEQEDEDLQQLLKGHNHSMVDAETLRLWTKNKSPVTSRAANRSLHLLNVRGTTSILCAEFVTIWRQVSSVLLNYYLGRKLKYLATTVHKAKNREFDYVVIIWPFQIKANGLAQRKLLYNAITRARKGAIILVQNKKALTESPALQLIPGL